MEQRRIAASVDDGGYSPSSHASQCLGTARSTGLRCQIRRGLDASGFCRFHSQHRPMCQGFRVGGEKCSAAPKPGYAYCCSAHDPAIVYYAPSLFGGDATLRGRMEEQVVRRYDGRDAYHGDAIGDLGALEMDHILEKQCFAHTFRSISFERRARGEYGEDVLWLASVLREEVVNRLDNLCLTRTRTNRIKGTAVWKFLDDSVTGHRGSKSFTDYMLGVEYWQDGSYARVGRDTTRAISGAMSSTIKWCQYKLADEGETPMLDAISDQLQRLYVDMELHSSTTDGSVGHGGLGQGAAARVVTASSTAQAEVDGSEAGAEPDTEPLEQLRPALVLSSASLPASDPTEPSDGHDFMPDKPPVDEVANADIGEQDNTTADWTERKMAVASTIASTREEENEVMKTEEEGTDNESSGDAMPAALDSTVGTKMDKLLAHETTTADSVKPREHEDQSSREVEGTNGKAPPPDRLDKADTAADSASDSCAPTHSSEESTVQPPMLETCTAIAARQEGRDLAQVKQREEDIGGAQDEERG